MKKKLLIPLVVFALAVGGLALTSWNYLTRPSPHFHFVDLVESWMAGRLYTDTPHRHKGREPLPDDPPGLQDAVERQLEGPKGGWNDWVAYYEVTLKGGDKYKGVWPWKSRKAGQAGHEKKNLFITVHGEHVQIDRHRDVATACVQPPSRSDKEAWRVWQERDRYEAQRVACAEVTAESPKRCPRGQRKVTCVNKRHFVSFPPMPAVLMAPFVPIWHYDLHDVWFTLIFAGLAAVMLLMLLRRLAALGYSPLNEPGRLALVFLFVFGTVFYFSAIRGQVWFTALIIGVFFHLCYLWAATELKHPLLAGLALAFGFATRVTLLFAAAYFALQILLVRKPWNREGIIWRVKKTAWFALPTLAVGIGLMFYNLARFDSPFEFGHRFLLDGTRNSIVDHGLFAFWFLSRNLSAALTNVPQFTSVYPYIHVNGHGLSLLFTTPVLLYLLWPVRGNEQAEGLDRFRWPMRRILWLTVLITALPGLLYQNTGWFQFGYRFGLDYLPLLFVLLAMDHRKRGAIFYVLIAFAFAVNLFGAITFQRMPMYY